MTDLATVVGSVAEQVRASTDLLNRLDGQAGDGDLGVTMATAATIVLDLLPRLEAAELPDALRECGKALASGAPSTAGTLLATGFLQAARVAPDVDRSSPAGTLAALLGAAVDGIASRGKAATGDKTMLDALAPAVEAARASADRGEPIERALQRAADAADEGAKATAMMRPVHGRAAWLAERSAGHEDAGARLVAIVLQAAADGAAIDETGGDDDGPAA